MITPVVRNIIPKQNIRNKSQISMEGVPILRNRFSGSEEKLAEEGIEYFYAKGGQFLKYQIPDFQPEGFVGKYLYELSCNPKGFCKKLFRGNELFCEKIITKQDGLVNETRYEKGKPFIQKVYNGDKVTRFIFGEDGAILSKDQFDLNGDLFLGSNIPV